MHTVRCRGSPTKGTKSEAATSHLPSGGSPAPNVGQKSELATSPLPSRGPKRGHNCYVTRSLAFSGVLNKGHEITRGYLTRAFPGVQKRVELLRSHCILGGSPTPNAGTKSEVAASPLPSRGPKRGWSSYPYRAL